MGGRESVMLCICSEVEAVTTVAAGAIGSRVVCCDCGDDRPELWAGWFVFLLFRGSHSGF